MWSIYLIGHLVLSFLKHCLVKGQYTVGLGIMLFLYWGCLTKLTTLGTGIVRSMPLFGGNLLNLGGVTKIVNKLQGMRGSRVALSMDHNMVAVSADFLRLILHRRNLQRVINNLGS